jgi:hypothetical protein
MNVKLATLVLLSAFASGQPPLKTRDWQLVRSVANGFGGTKEFVLIPDGKQRDRKYYVQVADAVCGSRPTCMVDFWTDAGHIPDPARNPEVSTGWIAVSDLAFLTASYERSPKYKKPMLNLACRLYPNKRVGEADNCAYNPGAPKPPDR